jgi:hypothetical protein
MAPTAGRLPSFSLCLVRSWKGRGGGEREFSPRPELGTDALLACFVAGVAASSSRTMLLLSNGPSVDRSVGGKFVPNARTLVEKSVQRNISSDAQSGRRGILNTPCTVPQLTARRTKKQALLARTHTKLKNQAMASSTMFVSSLLASPSCTGQRALAEFPGKSSIMLSRTVHNYAVPDHLLIPAASGGGGETGSSAAAAPWSSPPRGNGTSNSTAAGVDSFVGISVLKVNKVRTSRSCHPKVSICMAGQSIFVYKMKMYSRALVRI